MINSILLALDVQTMKISAIVLLSFIGILVIGFIVIIILNIINNKNIEDDELPDVFADELSEEEESPEVEEKSAFDIDNSDISMFDESNEAFEIISSIRDASESENSVKNKLNIFSRKQK